MAKRRIQPTSDEAELQKRFGAVVRIFRKRLGLSQEELAWRADIHRTYLANIERGGRNISLSSIVRIVGALGISLAEFFFTLEEYFASPIENDPPAPRPPITAKPRRVVRKRGIPAAKRR